MTGEQVNTMAKGIRMALLVLAVAICSRIMEHVPAGFGPFVTATTRAFGNGCSMPALLLVQTCLCVSWCNHRVVWVGRTLKVQRPAMGNDLPLEGPQRPFTDLPWGSGPRPTWPWALPGMGHPQLLWATCASVSSSKYWDSSISSPLTWTLIALTPFLCSFLFPACLFFLPKASRTGVPVRTGDYWVMLSECS